MLKKKGANKQVWPIIVHFLLISIIPASYANELDRARAHVEQFMQATGAPGLSITVMVNGERSWSEGFGLADIQKNSAVTPHTPMRIGSISKSITAAAIAKAREQGLIDIDSDIHTYVPRFPDKGHSITARQLGGHIGGIRSYKTESEQYVSKHYETVSQSLSLFEDDPLIAVPETAFHYSSYGYSLLAAAAEAATRSDFLTFLTTYLWAPLGMKNTGQDNVLQVLAGKANQYVKGDQGALTIAPYTDDSYKFAGSGMVSSSHDLAMFGNALISDQFLDVSSKELLFSSQKTKDGKSTGYGFGWFVDMPKFLSDRRSKIPHGLYTHLNDLIQERKLVWHSGTASGAAAMLLLAPETGVVIAVVTNFGGATVGQQLIVASLELEALFSNAVTH